MSLIETITDAQARGAAIRPADNGFPHLMASLRDAGVTRIEVTVPSWTTVLSTADGSVVQQGTPLVDRTAEVPTFDRDAFIDALRANQHGESTYPEWLRHTWQAGVAWYVVDVGARTCTYRSPAGDTYVEDYDDVDLDAI